MKKIKSFFIEIIKKNRFLNFIYELLKKYREQIKAVFSFFIIITLVVYFSLLARFVPGRPYPVAKIIMSGAMTVNIMYVMPLNKLGYRNIFTQPFYFVRDNLYKAGMRFIPKDDGEREMWWAGIRYPEYDRIVNPMIYKTLRGNGWEFYQNAELYDKWTKEVHEHIEPMATLKIKDDKFRKQRFGLFVDVVYEFLGRHTYVLAVERKKTGLDYPYKELETHIAQMKKVLDIFLKSIEYTKEYEPEGWHHFKNETRRYFYDDKIISLYSSKILFNLTYEGNNKNFSCSSPYIKLHGDARKNLKNYYENDIRLTSNMRTSVEMGINWNGGMAGNIMKLCPDNIYLEDIVKYREDEKARCVKYWQSVSSDKKVWEEKCK